MNLEFKAKYNHWIKRLKKADKYFSDLSIDDNVKMQYLEEYNCIIKNISKLITEYEIKMKMEIPYNIKMNGF